MLLARVACLRTFPSHGLQAALAQASPTLRNSCFKTSRWLLQPNQGYATKTRFGFRRVRSAREDIKQAAIEPSMETAAKIHSMGKLIVAGADRIRSTYVYFAGSVGLTALSAVAVSRSPALMSLMMRGSWLAIGATFAAMIGAGMLVRSISYEENPGAKHLAWMLHAGVMGAVVAPLTLLGGPLLIRAAWYTAGIVGGLSTVAVCAPSEKFLNMGGPLGVGLGLVLASSIGSMFLPPTSAFGAGLYSVAIYGGLVLFGMFLLYDTQKVIRRAETHPMYGVAKYDPINSCLGIYTDTLNIFIRVAMILSGSGSRKK